MYFSVLSCHHRGSPTNFSWPFYIASGRDTIENVCILRICPLNEFLSHSLVTIDRLFMIFDSELFSTSHMATQKNHCICLLPEIIVNLPQCTKFITINFRWENVSQVSYCCGEWRAWKTMAIVFENLCIFSVPHLKICSALHKYTCLKGHTYNFLYMKML